MPVQTTVADHLKNVPSTVRPIVRAARRVVKSAAPKAEEIAYQSRPPRSRSMLWKLTRYTDESGDVAGIGVFPTYACLYFHRGRELDDPSGLLEGGGKDMRFVRLRAAADAERPAVKRLVRGAFKLGSKR